MNIQSNPKNIAYISMGSNLGDKLENCRKAISGLEEAGVAVVERQSDFYLTEPMEYKDQAWFVNAAIEIKTGMDPFTLLHALKTMEHNFGRVAHDLRYGPRVLDLDIIFYNNEVIDSPGLVIPHPRMHYREFVLRPLCDLSPDFMHPALHKSVRQLLDEIEAGSGRCIKMRSLQISSNKLVYKDKGKSLLQEEINGEVFY